MINTADKERLSVIFGDDLEAVGNIVVVRNDNEGIYLVNTNGEMVLPHSTYGVGQFLGPGGFNYVVLSKISKKDVPIGRGSLFTMEKLHYTYNVYDSNFNWIEVRDTDATVIGTTQKMDISIRGKFYTVYLENGILKEKENRFWF